MRREIMLSAAMPVIGSRSAWTRRTEERGMGRDAVSRIGLSGSSDLTVFVLMSAYICVIRAESFSRVSLKREQKHHHTRLPQKAKSHNHYLPIL